MVNVGIAGLGFMAATHIRAYQQLPEVRIAALCNPSGKHLDGDFSDVAGNLGTDEPLKLDMSQIQTYRDFQEMVSNPEIQMVDICAPTHTHPDLAIAALEAGKHALVEKPFARTSEEARRILETAATSQGYLMPAMCLRFWPEWAWLKTVAQDNRFGKILGARFSRVAQPPAWGKNHFHDGSKSGGALLDLHIHDVDFVQFLFGRPKTVYSTGYTKYSGAIDYVVTQYQVESGASVHAEGGWAMSPPFGFNMSYTVNFERATVDFNIARGAEEALKVFEPEKDPMTPKLEGANGFFEELRYFANCIRNKTPPETVTGADGLSSVEICEAEEKSLQTGQVVEIR